MPDPSIAGLPALTSVAYASGVLTAALDAVPSAPLVLGVFQNAAGGTPAFSTNTSSQATVLAVDASQLQPGSAYVVAVRFASAPNAWGAAAPLVWQPPTLTRAALADGVVEVGWTVPPAAGVAAVRAQVYDRTGGRVVVTGSFTGAGARLVPPVPLDPAGSYTVQAAGVNGVATGPQVALAPPGLITAAPTVASVAYAAADAGAFALTVAAQASDSAPGTPVGRLLRDGRQVAQQAAGTDGTVVFALHGPLDPAYRWEVSLLYASGVAQGPEGLPARVATPAPPAILSLTTIPGVAAFVLDAVPVPAVTAALFQGLPAGRAWIASATTTQAGGSISFEPSLLQPGQQYTVAVAVDAGSASPAWGPGVPVVWQSPTLTRVAVAGSAVEAEWTLPTASGNAAVRAVLYDTVNHIAVAQGVFSGTGARLAAAGPLDPGGSYTVRVTGVNGVSAGPGTGLSAPLVLASPVLLSGVYGAAQGGAYSVAARVQVPDPAPGTAVVRLVCNGRTVAQQAAGSDGSAGLALAGALDPGMSWQLQTLYQTGIAWGPPSPGAEVPVLAPRVTHASFDGASFHVEWALPAGGPGATGAAVQVVGPGGQVFGAGTASGFSADFPPLAPMDPADAFQVMIAPVLGTVTGAYAPGPMLVLPELEITGVACDGDGVLVTIGGAAAPATGTRLRLKRGGDTVALAAAGLTGGYVALPPDGVSAFAVDAQPIGRSADGPFAPGAPVITGRPGVCAVTATAGQVKAVMVVPSNTTGIRGYAGSLYEGGALVAGPVGAVVGGGGALPTVVFPYRVRPDARYTVRVQAIGASPAFTGPVSSAAGVVSAVPAITAVGYDGTNVTATWDAVLDPTVTAYTVTLTGPGDTVMGSPVTVEGTSAALPATLSGTTAYTVTVQALGDSAVGPASAAASVVSETVSMTGSTYDGTSLTLSWPAATTSGASYLAQVMSGGAVIASQAASGTSAIIPIALAPGGSYTAAVSVVSGIATGTAGTAAGVITAIPGVSQTTATATTVTATVAVPSSAPANVLGYQGFLYDGGTLVSGPVAAVSSGGTTTVTFTSAVMPQGRHTVAIQGIGATSAVAGPLGPAAGVVSAVPTITALSYDGTNVMATWDAALDPSITAYTATLAGPGDTVVGSPVTVEGTSAALPATLAGDEAYTVTVRALGDSATGPASAAASVVSEAVAVTGATYDGTSLTLSWPAATTSGASYLAQVTSGGAVLASQAASGTSAIIPIALAPGGSYAAAVRVVSGIATGTAGTAAGVITAIPGVSQTTATATAVRATVAVPSAATNVTCYQGFLYDGGTLVSGPVAAASSGATTTVTFASAIAPQGRYTVAIQAIGATSAVAGPLGPAAGVVSAVPTITALSYDGTNVIATWDAVLDPNVTAYMATLATSGGAAVSPPVSTPGPRAVIPAPSLALRTSYVVTVQAAGPAATGPASAPADPLADSVGYFFPTAPSTTYPYLFRGDLRGPAPANITLYLPQLFATPPAASIVVQPFTLANAGSTAFPLTLTVPLDALIQGQTGPWPAGTVWGVDQNGIRPALQAAYVAFLQAVEANAAGVLAGAVPVLRQAIAQALPLTFAETLYYAYGLDPTAGAVDLLPGMRLRVDYEQYQAVPLGTGGPLLSGYTGAGTSVYDVAGLPHTGGAGSVAPLAMSPFFAGLQVPVAAGNSGGGGGILDLLGGNLQMPYLRLLFPPTLSSADGGGSVGVAGSIVFLSAVSFTQLQAATAQYNLTQGFGTVRGIDYTWFRGRAALFPEVAVWVDGSLLNVPLGTTVRQVVERVAALPYGVTAPLTGFSLRRPVGAVVSDPAAYAAGYGLGRSNPVNFGPQALAAFVYASGLDAFDLPVLGGDVLCLADAAAGDG